MVTQDQLNVKENKISNNELCNIVGGRSISGTLINATVTVYKTIFNFGSYFGSSIRRIYKKKLCSLN